MHLHSCSLDRSCGPSFRLKPDGERCPTVLFSSSCGSSQFVGVLFTKFLQNLLCNILAASIPMYVNFYFFLLHAQCSALRRRGWWAVAYHKKMFTWLDYIIGTAGPGPTNLLHVNEVFCQISVHLICLSLFLFFAFVIPSSAMTGRGLWKTADGKHCLHLHGNADIAAEFKVHSVSYSYSHTHTILSASNAYCLFIDLCFFFFFFFFFFKLDTTQGSLKTFRYTQKTWVSRLSMLWCHSRKNEEKGCCCWKHGAFLFIVWLWFVLC